MTPNFPEYTSGHSTFSGAAAAVLARFFDEDDFSFTIGNEDLPGVERSYSSFADAAAESGKSRIYGGIHFQSANKYGLKSGNNIGRYVSKNLLQPVKKNGGRWEQDDKDYCGQRYDRD